MNGECRKMGDINKYKENKLQTVKNLPTLNNFST
jgi:hypothetical protein